MDNVNECEEKQTNNNDLSHSDYFGDSNLEDEGLRVLEIEELAQDLKFTERGR